MIDIIDKKDCCGCSACASVCPKLCIEMVDDDEGFKYPFVNQHNCIDCDLCEKVCPVLHPLTRQPEPKTYAAKALDDAIRLPSSSGGVFMILASEVVRRKGVVFGARWDASWKVVHGYAETMEGIEAFRGSKYMQSDLKDSFSEVRRFLNDGRLVLFSGVFCQIAGLKKYLRRPYGNLILIDVICHSVPSPKVFQKCLAELMAAKGIDSVGNIRFRGKSDRSQSMFTISDCNGKTVYSKELYDTSFGKGFGSNLFARPSCAHCPAKGLTSGSDITLGDFWGIENIRPEFHDHKGVSVVLIHTEKGAEIFESVKSKVNLLEESYSNAVAQNPALEKAFSDSSLSVSFSERFEQVPSVSALIIKMTRPTLRQRLRRLFVHFLTLIGVSNYLRRLYK